MFTNKKKTKLDESATELEQNNDTLLNTPNNDTNIDYSGKTTYNHSSSLYTYSCPPASYYNWGYNPWGGATYNTYFLSYYNSKTGETYYSSGSKDPGYVGYTYSYGYSYGNGVNDKKSGK